MKGLQGPRALQCMLWPWDLLRATGEDPSTAQERTPDWSLGKISRACVECGIRLVSNNGRHQLPTSLAAWPLCKAHVQPQPEEPSPWSDLPSFTVKVLGSGAAKLAKHSVPEQHHVFWGQKDKLNTMQELNLLQSPHYPFSCLSPCSSWDTGLSFKKAAPVPQQYLSWAQGHQKQSLTVSRSRKHRPVQSLGGNYLLIASVSQKHHSNSSWDSRFIQQISTLGASFPS